MARSSAAALPPRAPFRRALLAWYDRHRRPLPWRAARDPYRIWLSEIMLQQTRVAAVAEPYQRFLRRFPDVQTLARARLASVLAVWSGLGYYRRARNLHAAARLICSRGGSFPRTAAAWRELPGVGRYTAAAVASIAFHEPCAVLDGNVERVLQRLTGCAMAQKEMWAAVQALLSPRRPGDFNQAMMELGATVCLPAQPNCRQCPVARWCSTRGRGIQVKLPPRRKAKLRYLLAERQGSVLLVCRPATSALMPGMYELPALPAARNPSQPALRLRHSITTTDYTVHVFRDAATSRQARACVWIPRSRLPSVPLTGLARKALRASGLLV